MAAEPAKSIKLLPIKGVFEPAFFKLPQVDMAMLDFLRHIVMDLAPFLTLSMIAFFHHSSVGEEDHVFYRWFSWNLDANDELFEKCEKYRPGSHVALNLKARDPDSYLAATFLKRLAEGLEKELYDEIHELSDFQLKNGESGSITRPADSHFWFIEDPSRFKAFKETLKNQVTAWTVYCPLFVSSRLAGLFGVDGVRADEGKKLLVENSDFRLKLEAVLKLISISIETLFKSHYSYLDEPPEGVPLTGAFWNRNDECLVFGPAFLNELKGILSIGSEELDPLGLYDPLECQLVSYWDANGIKEINDRLSSHPTGNEVIRTVGRWIHDSFEKVVQSLGVDPPPPFWVIRWGGDEFIVLLAAREKLTGEQRKQINALLSNSLDAIFETNVGSVTKELCNWRNTLCPERTEEEMRAVLNRVGVSGGWSWCIETDKNPIDSAENRAERAMYVAKSIMKGPFSGRGGSVALEFDHKIDGYNKFLHDLARSDRVTLRLKRPNENSSC